MAVSTNSIVEVSRSHTSLVVVNVSFVLAGVVTIILGPLLPILIARWSLSDQGAGLFFTLQFFGNLLGILSVGWWIAHRGHGQTIGLGFVLIACALVALDLGGRPLGLIATAWFGYGLGLVLTTTNLWVAQAAGARRAAALTISNLAWGIGAVACPLLVMLAQRNGRLGLLLFSLAGLSVLSALILSSLPREAARPALDPLPADSVAAVINPLAGIVLGALFFLYCGTESAIGGWIAAYAQRNGSIPGGFWELAPMFFWAGLLAGRAAGPLFLGKVPERLVLVLGLALAAAGNGALLWLTDLSSAAICVVAIGLGFACIFPLLVASLVGLFGPGASRIGSVAFALASLGGATIPWLVGFTSTRTGSLRAGLFVPFAGCLIMFGLLWLLPKQPLSSRLA